MRRILHRMFLAALGASIPTPAQSQVEIGVAEMVAPPRTDPGTGICATTVHLLASLFNKPEDAIRVLDNRADPNINNNPPPPSRLFTTINLRNNDVNSLGDFSGVRWPDELMSYSLPPEGDSTRITIRVRGYFNVPSTLAGKTIAFGLNCDDVCQVKIGKSKKPLDPIANDDAQTSRIIYPVKFTQAGLYPVEVIYFQNGAAGYAEWARTDVEVKECGRDVMGNILGCNVAFTDPSYADKFKLIDKSELYSSIVGENAGCQECNEADPKCSIGNYCGDGLCQSCGLPDHCGPNCVQCPASARFCSLSRCVQCTEDEHCPSGKTCDRVDGKCMDPIPCRGNEDCPSIQGKICDSDQQICIDPPHPCTVGSGCPAGQVCTNGLCRYFHTYPRLQVTGCSANAGRSAKGLPEEMVNSLGLLASSLLGAALLRSRLRQKNADS